MAKVRVSSVKPPAFSLERLIQVMPTKWLERVADPSANYRGGAMVRRETVGDGEVVEFRCLLGQMIPAEMEGKGLGTWVEKESSPETYDLILLLYRTFGPMNWGDIGRQFDDRCFTEGHAKVGAWIKGVAERELMLREEIPHEKRVAQLVEAWRVE